MISINWSTLSNHFTQTHPRHQTKHPQIILQITMIAYWMRTNLMMLMSRMKRNQTIMISHWIVMNYQNQKQNRLHWELPMLVDWILKLWDFFALFYQPLLPKLPLCAIQILLSEPVSHYRYCYPAKLTLLLVREFFLCCLACGSDPSNFLISSLTARPLPETSILKRAKLANRPYLRTLLTNLQR